jgi:sphingomyelin phosphodiesterase acid-like 3
VPGMRQFLAAFAAAVALLAAAVPGSASAAGQPVPWLLLSDVHFTPFLNADTALITQLQAAPVEGWQALLDGAGGAPSPQGKDTNETLLNESLVAMQRAAPRPPVVLLTGDLLAHDFQETYQGLMPGASTDDQNAFIDKTIAYLALRFNAVYPHAQFLATLGNNDSWCGDYEIAPDSPFLSNAADAWAPLVNRYGRAPGFKKSFGTLGSYVAKLPRKHLRAIAIDDIFWSSSYENTCGSPSADPGLALSKWLVRAVRSIPRTDRAWMATHVPPGIDVYASLNYQDQIKVTPLLSAGGQASLMTALESRRFPLLAFGHLHMSTYRVGQKTPMLGIPSISPIFGNNPAFIVADVSPKGGVEDFTTYAMDLTQPDPSYTREYNWGDTYGLNAFDPGALRLLTAKLGRDADLRAAYSKLYDSGGKYPISAAQYPYYACGSTALDPTTFSACVAG